MNLGATASDSRQNHAEKALDLIREVRAKYVRPTDDLLDLFAGSHGDQPQRDRIRQRFDEARQVKFEKATIVIASWENRFAAAGGVRTVTQEYARYLTSQQRTVRVITPLHTGLRTPPGAMRPVSVLWLDFDNDRRRVEIFESEWSGVSWVSVKCDSFFSAEGGRDRTNPYLYEDDDWVEVEANTSPRLVRDCLFFAAVLPKVLVALQIVDDVILHLQDWETAAAALTLKTAILRKDIQHAICVLALHNPYDKFLSAAGWAQLTDRPEPTNTPHTFLGRMLPLLDAPPSTVSCEFAIDLVTDPLQTTHLADHLQPQFNRYGIFGVDNGEFLRVDPPFTRMAIEQAQSGRPEAILAEKGALRRALQTAMANYRPTGKWGDVDFANLDDRVPVFMCVGRLDPGQKGFDVAARAIEIVLGANLDARFVLTPIVGNAPDPYVDDLEKLATDFSGRVVVYPFQMQQGYVEIQAGCTFSIWPSMYEPFGGVSEFLLRGTPIIARSTGGLRQQVENFDRANGTGNGLRYETTVPAPGDGDWSFIQQRETPAERMQSPVYRDQVEQLARSIRAAVEIFQDPVAYGRLLSNVYDSVAGYSWQRAAQEYGLIYEIASQSAASPVA